jgi:hypothetical protein
MRQIQSLGIAVLGAVVGGAIGFFWMLSQADDMVSVDGLFGPTLLGAALGAILLSRWYVCTQRRVGDTASPRRPEPPPGGPGSSERSRQRNRERTGEEQAG